MVLDITQAIPLGLILNELIINCLISMPEKAAGQYLRRIWEYAAQ